MDSLTSPPHGGSLPGATPRSAGAQALEQPHQPDERLRVLGLSEDRIEIAERADLDVDALVPVDLGSLADVRDAGGEVEPDLLVGEPGRRVEGPEVLPVLGLLADLLGQLALGGLERALPRL